MNSFNRLPSAADSCRQLAAAVTAMLLAVPLASCSRGPAPVRQPSIDATAAGNAAMEQYDTNGDRVVAGEELDKAPGLKAALPRLDTDGDNAVSAEEVAARVREWQESAVGLMSFGFTVTLNGSPLADAVVTFEPESFLGEEIKPATCKTNMFGGGGATIAPEDRPDPSWPSGMHVGVYKVKISKIVGGKETIPARYNKETILGQEVALDVPDVAVNSVVYKLTN